MQELNEYWYGICLQQYMEQSKLSKYVSYYHCSARTARSSKPGTCYSYWAEQGLRSSRLPHPGWYEHRAFLFLLLCLVWNISLAFYSSLSNMFMHLWIWQLPVVCLWTQEPVQAQAALFLPQEPTPSTPSWATSSQKQATVYPEGRDLSKAVYPIVRLQRLPLSRFPRCLRA